LRGKTFAVLRFLVDHPGQLVTKAALLDAVWAQTSVSDTMPTICVGELRKALSDDARIPKFIETVHGRGYRFIAKVTVAATLEALAPWQAAQHTPVPIMVGREDQLAQLHGWFAKATEGKRQVVFVAGEAGIGKTTFVRAFLDSLPQDVVRIGRGQCIEQYGSGEPYMPVLEALTRLGQEPGGERLREILHRLAPTWLAQMPALLTEEERARLQNEAPGTTPQRMLGEMTGAIEAMTTDAPLILLLEDLHWSDFSTLELISAIARRVEPARLMILGAYRQVDMLGTDRPLRRIKEELELHNYCVELRLKLLSERNVAEYLGIRFSDGATAHVFNDLAPAIHQRTEGNPLFMVNVVDYLEAQAPPLDASEIEAPRGILQMIERNFERLSADEQVILECASVAGAEFSAAAVAAALMRPTSEVEACCTRLSRNEQFIRSRGATEWPDTTVAGAYAFLHALYREVLCDRVPPGHLIELHRRIAERVEAGYGERAGEMAAELAHHYERAKDNPKAVKYFQLAGERALARGAMVEAERHYVRGLELISELPQNVDRDRRELGLQVGLGLALWGGKGWGHADTHRAFTFAQALGEKLGETHQLIAVLNGLWISAFSRAQMRASQELAERMARLAELSDDRGLLCVANYAFGTTLLWRAQFTKAQEHLDLASSYFDEADTRPLIQLAGNSIVVIAANVALHQGFPDRARHLINATLQFGKHRRNSYHLAFARMSACLLSIRLCDQQALLMHAEELRSLANEVPFFKGHVEYFADVALAMSGKFEDGLARTRRANALWESIEFHLSRTYVLQTEAEFYASDGRVDEALGKITEALSETEEVALRRPEILTLRGDLLVQNGASVSDVEAAYREALECARAQNNRWDQLQSTIHFARRLKSEGRTAEAFTLLSEIYNWFTEGFDTRDLKEAKSLLDELSISSGGL